MENTKRNNLVAIILSVLLAYLTYQVVLYQLTHILSDYTGHLTVYLPTFYESWLKGWQTVPYCMWHLVVLGFHHMLHIPLADAAALSSCVFSLFSFFVIYWMILRCTAASGKEAHSSKAAFVAFGLCVIQSLFFYWLDAGDRFLGPYSMNPVHNPTQMCVRPFSLLCFCLVYDIWNKQQDDAYAGVFFQMKGGLKKPFIYLSVFLFLSTLAKPTFAEMFIPAVGILMLAEWIRRMVKKDSSASLYLKDCLHMLLCAVPSLAYIFLQFAAYFIWDVSYAGDESVIVTEWLEVWSMFTENVVLSIAIGMAFPLFMILIDVRFYLKNNLGKLALAGYAVGFFEAALLGESGDKLGHGNFMWPMISGMLLMWTASTLHLLTLERTKRGTRLGRMLIDGAWFLFCVHVLFGILYMKSLMTMG